MRSWMLKTAALTIALCVAPSADAQGDKQLSLLPHPEMPAAKREAARDVLAQLRQSGCSEKSSRFAGEAQFAVTFSRDGDVLEGDMLFDAADGAAGLAVASYGVHAFTECQKSVQPPSQPYAVWRKLRFIAVIQ